MNQEDLNNKLLAAVKKAPFNESEVTKLLKSGANPNEIMIDPDRNFKHHFSDENFTIMTSPRGTIYQIGLWYLNKEKRLNDLEAYLTTMFKNAKINLFPKFKTRPGHYLITPFPFIWDNATSFHPNLKPVIYRLFKAYDRQRDPVYRKEWEAYLSQITGIRPTPVGEVKEQDFIKEFVTWKLQEMMKTAYLSLKKRLPTLPKSILTSMALEGMLEACDNKADSLYNRTELYLLVLLFNPSTHLSQDNQINELCQALKKVVSTLMDPRQL